VTIQDPLKPNEESLVFRSREAFLIFCVMVAGKNGKRTVTVCEKLLEGCRSEYHYEEGKLRPFAYLRELIGRGGLHDRLVEIRCGQYGRIARALIAIVDKKIDADDTSVEQLEEIPGIGPKTSRYFMMRAHGQEHAALDTHVLKWLRRQGWKRAPKSTPGSMKVYRELENAFIMEAHNRGLTPDELDVKVWEHYAQGAPFPE
jgi:endonuclease III